MTVIEFPYENYFLVKVAEVTDELYNVTKQIIFRAQSYCAKGYSVYYRI